MVCAGPRATFIDTALRRFPKPIRDYCIKNEIHQNCFVERSLWTAATFGSTLMWKHSGLVGTANTELTAFKWQRPLYHCFFLHINELQSSAWRTLLNRASGFWFNWGGGEGREQRETGLLQVPVYDRRRKLSSGTFPTRSASAVIDIYQINWFAVKRHWSLSRRGSRDHTDRVPFRSASELQLRVQTLARRNASYIFDDLCVSNGDNDLAGGPYQLLTDP